MDKATALAQGFTELTNQDTFEITNVVPAAGLEVEFFTIDMPFFKIQAVEEITDIQANPNMEFGSGSVTESVKGETKTIEHEPKILVLPFKGYTVSVTNLARAEYEKTYFLSPHNTLFDPTEIAFYREITITNENKMELAKELIPQAKFTQDHLLGLTVDQAKEILPGVTIVSFEYDAEAGQELPAKDGDDNSIQVGIDKEQKIIRVI